MPRKKRRRITSLKVNEISAVDRPAQEGARVLLLKRASGTQVNKGGLVPLVTEITDGHQHGVVIDSYNGRVDVWVQHASGAGDEVSHSHAVIRGDDGTFTLSTVAGHTHDIDSTALSALMVDAVTKGKEEPTMSKTAEQLQAELEKTQKAQKRLEQVVAMKAEHRAYFDELSESAQDTFLGKSEDDRQAAIDEAERRAAEKAAAEDRENPVMYTTKAGVKIRKNDGETVLALAKASDQERERGDRLEKELKEARKVNTDAELRKRAESDLKYLPGTVAVKMELLRAAERIEDKEAREAAVAALKSQNEALRKAFRPVGVSGTPPAMEGSGSAQDQLDELAEKYQKDHPGEKLTINQAMEKVLDTDEGRELYKQSVEETPAVMGDVD